MDWTEIKIKIPTAYIEIAGDIANLVVPYGIYIEDYSDLEIQAREVAHIDLIDEELLNADRENGIIHIYISPEDNPNEAVAFLEARLDAENIPHSIETDTTVWEDWINNWKKYFRSTKVGEKLLINPAWEDTKLDDEVAVGRVILNLEPGVAFGSGTHETTRLCLAALEKYVNNKTAMLDVGCGSGILSVAALLLGAKTAVGVDIDKLAVKTAIENGKMNGFDEDRYTVVHGDLTDKISGKYSLICANIVADAIILLSKNIRQFMTDDAVYIVSGIIDMREQEVKEALENYGFTIINRYEENGWICMELK
ncbi:MAG TPA: 50S ribosomal protein L11 methyltransferase [Clostridiales bacterium]|mgnify:CR=1 FL=1|nr:50S ribosomal protein L11 methyltransferase [Clostridiales bacterium]